MQGWTNLARAGATDGPVTQVTGAPAVAARALHLVHGARAEVLEIHAAPRSPLLAAVAAATREAAERGVRVRTLCARSALALDDAGRAFTPLMERRREVRIAGQIPARMLVVDGRVALTFHDGGASGLLIATPPLVDTLAGLFECAWDGALAVPAPQSGRAVEGERLRALLASGLDDRSIAHQLGMSDRTLRRRIARLMDELGAATRFQAGTRVARTSQDRRTR